MHSVPAEKIEDEEKEKGRKKEETIKLNQDIHRLNGYYVQTIRETL